MTSSALTSYDTVPYDSHPFAQTHPDRLAVVASLLGLRPAPLAQCKVLELGCAGGGNLVPMAVALPGARFLGVDLSSVQIADGQRLVEELDLKNIELKHLSILDVSLDIGKFDYILCHGVFSWVPNHVQEKIFAICAQNLAKDGIAYISYNTYPGWHMRGMIRDMLSYHSKQFVEPQTRVRQGRNLLDFLAKSVEKENSPYSFLLKQEVNSMRRSSDAYLFHEHLEDVNDPLYFHQFIERAAAHRLKYLGEADLSVMAPGNYPPEIISVLQMLSPDIIHLEQYMDFLRNRMFRQSLLCHSHQNPNYALKPDQLKFFYVGSPAKPKSNDIAINTTEEVLFETPDGITLNTRDPIVKAAMLCFAKVWPSTLPFVEVVSQARSALKAAGVERALEDDAASLAQAFLTFYVSASTSLLELHVQPALFTTTVSDKPEASPLARAQARSSNRVTNLRHESLFLGELERHLLRLMDRTNSKSDLAMRLGQIVASGELSVEKDGVPIRDEVRIEAMIRESIDTQLEILAKNAILLR